MNNSEITSLAHYTPSNGGVHAALGEGGGQGVVELDE